MVFEFACAALFLGFPPDKFFIFHLRILLRNTQAVSALGGGRVERTEEILRHDHFCPWIPGPAMGLNSYAMDDSYVGKNCPSQISLLFMGRP